MLANEEVVNGKCERCGSDVVHKNKSQWMLKITAYADRPVSYTHLADILFAPGTVLEISSTQVRALAARGGDISPLVPAEVQRIILREGLYRGGTDTTYKEARCH